MGVPYSLSWMEEERFCRTSFGCLRGGIMVRLVLEHGGECLVPLFLFKPTITQTRFASSECLNIPMSLYLLGFHNSKIVIEIRNPCGW